MRDFANLYFSVYTTTTKCPYTTTISTGQTPSVGVYQSDSTIYETVTSTICTKCYGPAPAPATDVPSGPLLSNTQAGVGVHPGTPESPTSYAIVTMTIVPLSESPAAPPPADTYVSPPQPAAPSQGSTGAAPYPVVNGTSPIGATGTSGSPSSASTAGVPGATLDSFTGAASKMGAGVLGGVLAMMVALML